MFFVSDVWQTLAIWPRQATKTTPTATATTAPATNKKLILFVCFDFDFVLFNLIQIYECDQIHVHVCVCVCMYLNVTKIILIRANLLRAITRVCVCMYMQIVFLQSSQETDNNSNIWWHASAVHKHKQQQM